MNEAVIGIMARTTAAKFRHRPVVPRREQRAQQGYRWKASHPDPELENNIGGKVDIEPQGRDFRF